MADRTKGRAKPESGREASAEVGGAANGGGEPTSNRVVYRDGDGNVKVRHRESGDDMGLPTDDEVKAFEESERASAAEAERNTRVNLKTSMVERLVGEGPDGERWEDVREATPDELAAAREAQADFDQ